MEKIREILLDQYGNYIAPFFWLHGEDGQWIREYMRIVQSANISAVCVESRPHPDFCGEKWWQDMTAIIDEAKKLDMKVWILDDVHFPTGAANGAMKTAPVELRRREIASR